MYETIGLNFVLRKTLKFKFFIRNNCIANSMQGSTNT